MIMAHEEDWEDMCGINFYSVQIWGAVTGTDACTPLTCADEGTCENTLAPSVSHSVQTAGHDHKEAWRAHLYLAG